MTDLKSSTRQQLADYLCRHPQEQAPLATLSQQLDDARDDIFSRANMRGHITTSGLVVDRARLQVLVIFHRTLARWLQPGGHYQAPSSLVESAAREVTEETGVRPCASLGLLDIETHAIAAHAGKREGAHVHHDFVYLFEADGCAPLAPQLDEVSAARWVPLATFAALPSSRFARMAGKLASRT